MPCLDIKTSAPRPRDVAAFLTVARKTLAKLLGKPEHMCLVVLQADVDASFGGNPGPAALAVLRSIGGISHEQNRTFCATFHPLFHKELGVPQENAFIFFEDFPKHNVGHASKTRADV